MPFALQPLDWIVILVVALIIFGPKRLPEIGRYVGKTITELRAAIQDLNKPITPNTPPAAPSENNTSFCTHCGAPRPAQARFCDSCGAALT